MSKIRLTKLFRFEMAHVLWGYNGPCRNIHGHSYELEVTVSGTPSNDSNSSQNGMLMDFGDMKRIVEHTIIEVYDHALVVNAGTPHAEFFRNQNTFQKIIFAPFQPTCENLISAFAEKLIPELPAGAKLQRLRLQETSTSWAEWLAEDNQ